ncbi:MAG: hypothetical protein IIX77_04430 [Oscillospiraceae bacterium]|nr:hypothetical protein [Oscillospiraceae bacterium]
MNLSKEDKTFLAHIDDMVERVQKNGRVETTLFLDSHQCSLAMGELKYAYGVQYRLYGGSSENERCILGISPEDIPLSDSAFGIHAVQYRYRKVDKLTHRDFLGCFMAQNISRELVGDIFVSEGETVAFVHKNALDILLDLDKIGRVGVTASRVDSGFDFTPQKEEQSFTVSSLRLDAIISAVCGKSRSAASELIAAGQVFVNHIEIESNSFVPKEGDTVSVRGFGKFVFTGVHHTTKKGKLAISISKYV